MKKHKWSTRNVIQETKDAVTIFFDTGQAAIVYQAGQYLNITCSIEGEQVSRSYSFSSAPSDKFPAITVKRVANGKMSNYLVDNAKHISEWNIEAPFGNFVLNLQFIEDSEVVFLAGGSGISPLSSMLKGLEDNVHKPLLLYANKTPEDTIFWSQLEVLKTVDRLNVFYSFSSDIQNQKKLNCISGRFSQLIIRSIIRKQIKILNQAHYYICGPAALMELYRDTLLGMNIPETQIHAENFNPVVVNNIALETEGIPKEVLVSYYEDMFLDDEQQTYECTSLIEVQAGQSLLDAMGANNIKVPNSCKKGTCGSCWATKENGHVQMVHNYALTDEEVSNGKILLCQSFPLDQSVYVVIV